MDGLKITLRQKSRKAVFIHCKLVCVDVLHCVAFLRVRKTPLISASMAYFSYTHVFCLQFEIHYALAGSVLCEIAQVLTQT